MSEFATPINTLTVNGTNLWELAKVYVDGTSSFNTPEKDYEIIEVPGRSGDLIIHHNRRKNLTIQYPCFILENFLENFAALEDFFYNDFPNDYVKIEDTYNADYFRLGAFSGPIEPTVSQTYQGAAFNLSFNCRPQRYLKSGETSISVADGDNIENETTNISYPIIRLYGGGNFAINDYYLTIAYNDDTNQRGIEIDCETHETKFITGTGNANQYVSFAMNFPILEPGNNYIEFNELNFHDVEIIPRWEL